MLAALVDSKTPAAVEYASKTVAVRCSAAHAVTAAFVADDVVELLKNFPGEKARIFEQFQRCHSESAPAKLVDLCSISTKDAECAAKLAIPLVLSSGANVLDPIGEGKVVWLIEGELRMQTQNGPLQALPGSGIFSTSAVKWFEAAVPVATSGSAAELTVVGTLDVTDYNAVRAGRDAVEMAEDAVLAVMGRQLLASAQVAECQNQWKLESNEKARRAAEEQERQKKKERRSHLQVGKQRSATTWHT